MRPVLGRDQMRAFDDAAQERGVPGIVLMENAGRGAAHLVGLKLRPRGGEGERSGMGRGVHGSCVRCADERSLSDAQVVIVCGAGNNGGDGFVVGRHLLVRGARVGAVLCVPRESLAGDAALAAASFEAVGGDIHVVSEVRQLAGLFDAADVVVDALLGTGVTREVSGLFAEVIDGMNASGKFIVALDLPSGLDAESGRVHGVAVRAAHTVTFAHLKAGLLTTNGAAHCGRITLSHIGVPATLPKGLQPKAWLLDEADVRPLLPVRAPSAHKKSVGQVAVVGGSDNMVGAARLAALAALRVGAGLSTVVSVPAVIDKLEGTVLELMTARHFLLSGTGAPSPANVAVPDSAVPETAAADLAALLGRMDALVIGPGLGRGPDALARARDGLAARKPTVLDADGLRAFEGRLGELRQYPWLVLTPHVGEAAGLLGISGEAVEADRFAAVQELTNLTGATVVLKGPRTLIADPTGKVYVSAFGSPALATGGSGDVLSGVIAGLLAGGAEGEMERELLTRMAWLGVALHGLAAEAWAELGGSAGLLASDLLTELPRTRARLQGVAPG